MEVMFCLLKLENADSGPTTLKYQKLFTLFCFVFLFVFWNLIIFSIFFFTNMQWCFDHVHVIPLSSYSRKFFDSLLKWGSQQSHWCLRLAIRQSYNHEYYPHVKADEIKSISL